MATGHAGIETATVYPDRTVLRSRDEQERKLRTCAVDPALYGNRLETGLFGQDGFKAMTGAGESLDGMVHVAQRFVLHRSVGFGEPLRQRGWTERDRPDPRGRRSLQVFEFVGTGGDLVVTAEMHRLTPDPARMGQKPAAGRRDADPRDGLRLIAEKQLRPEDVTGFSGDVGNLIHFAPDFARRYGYRAPVSQGIQTMIWMMAALAGRAAPTACDVTARFLRPVYWDDRLALWGDRTLLRTVTGDGRLAAELQVDHIAY